MKKIAVTVAVLLMCVSLFAQRTIKDANVQLREAKGYQAIRISNAFDVYLSQGNEESVAVSASEEKYREDIRVEVRNGVLEIDYKPKGKWFGGNKKLKAYISFKQLDRLQVSGACDVNVVGNWKADELAIELSGASDLTGNVDVQKLKLDLSGASDMQLSGSAVELLVNTSGASDFKGDDLVTEYCTARASGSSDIRLVVNKELTAEASGNSDIDYKGSGVVRDVRTSGSSSVSKKSS